MSEMSLDLGTQPWDERCGAEWSARLHQGRESNWQITVWFVIISELSKHLSLKESIPWRGERAIFLETPGWEIYLKWVENLFILAPPQIRWTVYLHEARKSYHFFESICPFEQNSCTLKLAVINSLPVLKALPRKPFPSSPLALLPPICIAWNKFQNFSTKILFSAAQMSLAGQVVLAPFYRWRNWGFRFEHSISRCGGQLEARSPHL